MQASALFRRAGLTLIAAGREAREMFAKIPEGGTVFVTVWHPRNMRQHKKYFAILRNVVEATGDRWASQEHLRKDILIATGRFDEVVNGFTGEVRQVAHSMKVASMPKDEFERLYDDTIKLLTDALGADPQMLTEEPA